jgi:ubiquinone/menaquinone biosynthesis C-methylase UbiE
MGAWIEEMYRLYPWPEDPSRDEGKRRYYEALNKFKVAVKHEWMNKLINSKKHLKIIELCSGTGIGGIALSKILIENGKSVELKMLDARREALEKALDFSLKELGFKAQIQVADILKPDYLEGKYDIALMYGFSSSHFNPWEMIKILSSIQEIIVEDGILLMEERDRIQGVFLRGYQQILPEYSENKTVLTIHKDYNALKGEFYRIIFDLKSGERSEMKVYFWGLAELMSMVWIFFKDVDFIPYQYGNYRGIIIAYKPRGKLTHLDFSETPKFYVKRA